MERPPEWNLKPAVSRQRRGRVPDVVLKSDVDRAWIACLTQGEGCIKTHYSKKTNSTAIEIGVNMTDPQPVFRFSDLVGVHRPKKAKPREGDLKPAWYTVVGGLRAYRVLQEIVPFLLGQKLEEAKRSLELSGPDGYREGCFGGFDIWPEDEFPLRRRGLGQHTASLKARGLASTTDPSDDIPSPPSEMDFCCMKIANALLQEDQRDGTTQTKLAIASRLGIRR